MKPALYNQPRQSLRIWIAIGVSMSLHAAAIAIAQLDRETIPIAAPPSLEPPGTWAPPEEPTPSEDVEPIATPPPEVVSNNDFPDEIKPTTPPRQILHIAAPVVRNTNMNPQRGGNFSSARILALSAPRPEYPYEARRSRTIGSGVALIAIDSASGNVVSVTMEQSTGSAVLDQATVAGLRRWRFKPNSPSPVRCPITFTLTGASF